MFRQMNLIASKLYNKRWFSLVNMIYSFLFFERHSKHFVISLVVVFGVSNTVYMVRKCVSAVFVRIWLWKHRL